MADTRPIDRRLILGFMVAASIIALYVTWIFYDMHAISVSQIARQRETMPADEDRQQRSLDLLNAISNKLDRVRVYIEEKAKDEIKEQVKDAVQELKAEEKEKKDGQGK
jgi:hypothetical protein